MTNLLTDRDFRKVAQLLRRSEEKAAQVKRSRLANIALLKKTRQKKLKL